MNLGKKQDLFAITNARHTLRWGSCTAKTWHVTSALPIKQTLLAHWIGTTQEARRPQSYFDFLTTLASSDIY